MDFKPFLRSKMITVAVNQRKTLIERRIAMSNSTKTRRARVYAGTWNGELNHGGFINNKSRKIIPRFCKLVLMLPYELAKSISPLLATAGVHNRRVEVSATLTPCDRQRRFFTALDCIAGCGQTAQAAFSFSKAATGIPGFEPPRWVVASPGLVSRLTRSLTKRPELNRDSFILPILRDS
jgi:hypothetical protein